MNTQQQEQLNDINEILEEVEQPKIVDLEVKVKAKPVSKKVIKNEKSPIKSGSDTDKELKAKEKADKAEKAKQVKEEKADKAEKAKQVKEEKAKKAEEAKVEEVRLAEEAKVEEVRLAEEAAKIKEEKILQPKQIQHKQNGVTIPKENSIGRKIWALINSTSLSKGSLVSLKELKLGAEEASKTPDGEVFNPNTIGVQYYRYKTFYGYETFYGLKSK